MIRKFLVSFIFALGIPFFIFFLSAQVRAAFVANNLIDDLTFDNTTSMTAAQIDSWLNTYFPNSCISPNSGFQARVPSGYSPSNGFTYGDFASAGQVVSAAAQAYNINPQVLLTTLQKEQSLVSGASGTFCNNGDENKYSAAVGYGCPDGGTVYNWTGVSLYRRNGVEHTSTGPTCVNAASKAGFSQQLIRGAWLLKFGEQRSEGNTSWAIVKPGWDNSDDPFTCYGGPMTQGSFKRCSSDPSPTYYDGYVTIDGTATHMDNGATAALYWYTPHFHGNQSFDSIFNQYFGIQFANDSYTAHPSGTLISLSGKVYLVTKDINGNAVKQWIVSSDVFNSYGYPWFQVKPATTGDGNLTTGANMDTLAPGTIFRSDNTPVYLMTYENGSLVKQQVSLSAFNSLGYNWSDVLYVQPSSVPNATSSTVLFSNQHPAGTLISGNGKVYLLDQSSKRWVLGPDAFTTNNFDWSRVKPASAADLSEPDGVPVNLRQGNMLLSGGGIYVVDYDNTGILKRPVGPWECYANRWHYAPRDLYQIAPASLPPNSGGLATC